MKNKLFLAGMIGIVLALGIVFIGCDDGSGGSGGGSKTSCNASGCASDDPSKWCSKLSSSVDNPCAAIRNLPCDCN